MVFPQGISNLHINICDGLHSILTHKTCPTCILLLTLNSVEVPHNLQPINSGILKNFPRGFSTFLCIVGTFCDALSPFYSVTRTPQSHVV